MSKKPSSDREAAINKIVEQMRRELEEQLPSAATLDQIEAAAGKIGQKARETIKRELAIDKKDDSTA